MSANSGDYTPALWIERRERDNHAQARVSAKEKLAYSQFESGAWKSSPDWRPVASSPGGINPSLAESDDSLFMIGEHCAICKAIDFLPLSCNKCQKTFCSEHGAAHRCPSPPIITLNNADSKSANILSTTALCSSATLTDTDTITSVPNPISKPKKRRCPVKGCKKSLGIFSIECKYCSQQFCSTHRFQEDHNCTALSCNTPKTATSRLLLGEA